MAHELEIIRGAYEAFARGDVPAVLSILSPDVSWTEAEGFPYGGTYKGPDAVLERVFMRLGADWDGFTVLPREFVVQGETVAAFGEYSGTCRGTGRKFSAPFAHLWHLKNGRVVRFHQHTDTFVVRSAMA